MDAHGRRANVYISINRRIDASQTSEGWHAINVDSSVEGKLASIS